MILKGAGIVSLIVFFFSVNCFGAEGPVIKAGNEMEISSLMLTLVLPLPGTFKGQVVRDNTVIGIVLDPGPDFTKEIITDKTSLPKEATDIIITGRGLVGSAYSEKGLEIPLMADPRSLSLKMNWEEGFLSMVQNDGRKIILKGTLTIPIIDPISQRSIYLLEYQFGENASVVWKKDSKKFNWSNMTVKKKKD